ncbi:C2H2 finger domain protein [Paecilomyces variotii No. 5]|uniref:C2H2 finger domain protein n=1 Tax=Byssochlamys spectabilis (strain No. 5 / NBRC 109023) TaxID=1356009 RepID=V5GAD5_BYSSN|nr:C2H2 finger domain protein [Paecilomyces variotii No. 5]
MHDVQNIPDTDPELQTPHGVTDQNMLGQDEKALSRYLEDMRVDTDIDGEIPMKDGDACEDGMQRIPLGPITRPMAAYPHSRKSDSTRAAKCAIRRSKQKKSKSRSESRDSSAKRLFACSFAHYGCESTFPSKNEWKRHVTSQHLQLGFYRCDVGDCKPSNSKNNRYSMSTDGDSPRSVLGRGRVYNDFNRKDLFTQHQRRMHAPWLVVTGLKLSQVEEDAFEASLDAVRTRCWHEKRKPPQQSQCGFCGKEFSGPRSWDERMEHVGKHFEKGEANSETEDLELRMWAIQEGIIRPTGENKWVLSSLQPTKG